MAWNAAWGKFRKFEPGIPGHPRASSIPGLFQKSSTEATLNWVCLKIGYIPNYSHLIGIMISKTIGFRGTLFLDTPNWRYWSKQLMSPPLLAVLCTCSMSECKSASFFPLRSVSRWAVACMSASSFLMAWESERAHTSGCFFRGAYDLQCQSLSTVVLVCISSTMVQIMMAQTRSYW